MLNGVDISQFQGTVDFNALKQSESFVMIRANFGDPDNASQLNEDVDFQRNRDQARSVGILHGFYHYAYPEYNTPEAEADFFASILSDLQENEILALDWEEAYSGDHVDWVNRFLTRLSSHFNGYKPLVYMNYNEATHQNWTPVINGDFGCWLADWDGTTSENYPAVPWAALAIKQYSDNSKVPGINGNVDGDVFYGDGTVFDKYGYHKPAPAPTPTPAPTVDPRDAEIATLQASVTNLTNENTSLQKQVSDLTSENTQLQNNLTVADNTINKDDLQIKDDAQKIADLTANVSEQQGIINDYENNEKPQYEKQIATLKSQIAELTKPAPVVNDPSTSLLGMEAGQAIKTISGFVPYILNRIFHKS